MKNTMTLFGCGPKLALLSLPYIILSLVIMFLYPDFFNLGFLDFSFFRILGMVWLAIGLIFWGYSASYFIKNFKPGKLLTEGPFALCRNPIYSAVIVFIFPSLGIIFHSGLLLSIAVVLYIGFKLSIHGETIILRRTFGETFTQYERTVNEIFPFPRKKRN